MRTLLSWVCAILLPLAVLSQAPLEKRWSTYYWCNDTQKVIQKIDGEGNIIVVTSVGDIRAPFAYYEQYTTVGAHKRTPTIPTGSVHTDIAICKFSKTGSLLWATYYGGRSNDFVYDLVLDNSGAIYITGYTNSSNVFGGISTLNSYYPNFQYTSTGLGAGFLAKFLATGQLLWATYLQGIGQSLAVDSYGVHVSGFTRNIDTSIFPAVNLSTAGCFICQPQYYEDNSNGFYLRFNTDGQREYGTYLGWFNTVKLAVFGSDVYFYGSLTQPQSINFASGTLTNQLTFGGGNSDGYVMKFNTLTNQIVSRSFYGGEEDDFINSAVAHDDALYFAGETNSITNIATAQSMQPNLTLTTSGQKSTDWFLGKLNANLNREFATYFGGNNQEQNIAMLLYNGNLFFTGATQSVGLANPNIHQENYEDFIYNSEGLGSSLFGAFNLSGQKLWSSYYNKVSATSIAVDDENAIYVAGKTTSDAGVSTLNGLFPVLDTYIPPLSTSQFRYNMFVTKFAEPIMSVSESQSSFIKIYPNPVRDKLNLSFENKSDIEFQINIFNTLGQEVLAKKYNVKNTATGLEIACEELSKGVYLIQVSSQARKFNYKIVKE